MHVRVYITRFLYSVNLLLLIISIGQASAQDPERYSDYRNEFFALAIDYKLEEALALSNQMDASDPEVLATRSIAYSLIGNRDKNNSYIQKGFDLVLPFQSMEDDYNIQAALAVSYGMQANHAGLKEKAKFSDLSVKHSKLALKLDPKLPHLNFILGRFYFELAGMGKATAKIAGSFISKEEINRASFPLALSYLKVASEMAPSRFLYNYYTGAAFKETGNDEKAMHYFRLADKNTRYTDDDRKADKDLQKQLK